MSRDSKKSLYKTKIVIWSDFDPEGYEIDDLAHQAAVGDAYCSRQDITEVSKGDLPDDCDWDGTEFFGDLGD
jgi:hypothetical protein